MSSVGGSSDMFVSQTWSNALHLNWPLQLTFRNCYSYVRELYILVSVLHPVISLCANYCRIYYPQIICSVCIGHQTSLDMSRSLEGRHELDCVVICSVYLRAFWYFLSRDSHGANYKGYSL
jgi:hypothetical protein